MTLLRTPTLFLFATLMMGGASLARSQPTLEQTLEKDGCATLETSKVLICKYDYGARKSGKVEAFTVRPVAGGVYPGVVIPTGIEGAKVSLNIAGLIAREGFACLLISEPGYGKSEGKPDFMGPMSIDAFAEGFKRFRRESFVDRNKMGIYGYSRGGMAAALLAVKMGKAVKAAVFGAGIYDLKRAYDEIGIEGIRENIRTESGLTDRALRARSAIFKMEKLRAPVLIIHGENDINAPTDQARTLAEKLTELGKDVRIIILPDHKHGQIRSSFINPMLDFLSRTLKGVPGTKYR